MFGRKEIKRKERVIGHLDKGNKEKVRDFCSYIVSYETFNNLSN